MEEMLHLIKDTAEALAAPRLLKRFSSTLGDLSKTAVWDSPVSSLVPLVQATMAPMLGWEVIPAIESTCGPAKSFYRHLLKMKSFHTTAFSLVLKNPVLDPSPPGLEPRMK